MDNGICLPIYLANANVANGGKSKVTGIKPNATSLHFRNLQICYGFETYLSISLLLKSETILW